MTHCYTPEHRSLVRLLPIDASYVQVLVLVCEIAVSNQAALVERLRKRGHELHGRGVESRRIDSVAIERSAESLRVCEPLACGGGECSEVPSLHGFCRN